MANPTDAQKKVELCEKYYMEYFKAFGDSPAQSDLVANGFSRDFIRHHWGSKTQFDFEMSCQASLSSIPVPGQGFRMKSKTKTFIVTGVQNNTKVNKRFMMCLEKYADYLGKAQIVGIPIYYRNPTSISQSKKLTKGYWWDKDFSGEFCSKRVELCDHLVLMGHHRIQATATNPLSSLENLGGNMSAIYGHGTNMMRPVANSIGDISKQIYTTMSCCHATNYSKTNVGGKAHFHHVLGAQLIEIKDNVPYIRQIQYDGKGFYDLDRYVTPSRVKVGIQAEALVCGDIHAEVADWGVVKKTFEGTNSLWAQLRPKRVILHDLLDFTCQSHHNRKNVFLNHLLDKEGKSNVSGALSECEKVLQSIPEESEIWVVDSNHHDHLTRWLNESNWKSMTPDNARFYLSLASKVLDKIYLTDELAVGGPSPFEIALEEIANRPLRFLSANADVKVKGIVVNLHGDAGPNGSRGTIVNLAKAGSKMIIGHSHSPGIWHGVYQVGKKCAMKQNYMKGPTSHMLTDAVIYPNGKRSLITFINNEYKGRD